MLGFELLHCQCNCRELQLSKYLSLVSGIPEEGSRNKSKDVYQVNNLRVINITEEGLSTLNESYMYSSATIVPHQ